MKPINPQADGKWWIDKGHVFVGLMLISSLVIFFSIRPISLTPNVKATLVKQNGSITTIDTPRNPSSTKVFYFDNINFENSTSLIHKSMGPLGYSNDFFIDFEAKMDVLEEKTYTFEVSSDDGFRLWIDDQQLAEWLGDRPVSSTPATVHLTRGRHNFRMSYFQGYGNLGLKVTYSGQAGSNFLLGESSAMIKFEQYSQ